MQTLSAAMGAQLRVVCVESAGDAVAACDEITSAHLEAVLRGYVTLCFTRVALFFIRLAYVVSNVAVWPSFNACSSRTSAYCCELALFLFDLKI